MAANPKKAAIAPVNIENSELFPPTRSQVLRAAADQDWTAFLAAYLRPCWREVLLVCRKQGVRIDDAHDVYQELLLRLMRPGRIKHATGQDNDQALPLGNLPARYLLGKQLGISDARFRTYLKITVVNLVREHLRWQRRRRERQAPMEWDELIPAIEQSITLSLDRQRVAAAILQAASDLRDESRSATTKAHRRQYAVLQATIAFGQSPEEIATGLGLSRSTVTGIMTAARARFIEILRARTGMPGRSELKQMLHHHAADLVSAFQQIRG